MKHEAEKCLIWMANHMSRTVRNKNWSDEFCRKFTEEIYNEASDVLKKYIDIKTLSRKEAFSLGFEPWRGDLVLIPLYLLPIIPIGMELISIDGETIIYDGSNVDMDTRHGCIAYGIRIPEKKDD